MDTVLVYALYADTISTLAQDLGLALDELSPQQRLAFYAGVAEHLEFALRHGTPLLMDCVVAAMGDIELETMTTTTTPTATQLALPLTPA